MVKIIKRFSSIHEDESEDKNNIQVEVDPSAEPNKDEREAVASADKISTAKKNIATERAAKETARRAYDAVRTQATKNINALKEKDAKDPSADNKSNIVKEFNKIRVAKTAYEEAAKLSELKMLKINADIAALNGDIEDNLIESLRTSYAVALHEAVNDNNRTLQLADIIMSAFSGLSFQPTHTQCRTLAKNVIGHMNKEGWADGSDHWDMFIEFITNTINRSIRISLGRNEITKLIDNLRSGIMASQMFAWAILGEREPAVVEDIPESAEADDASWVIDGVDSDTIDAIAEEYADLVESGVVEFDYDKETYKYSVTVRGTEDLANEISVFVEAVEGR